MYNHANTPLFIRLDCKFFNLVLLNYESLMDLKFIDLIC